MHSPTLFWLSAQPNLNLEIYAMYKSGYVLLGGGADSLRSFRQW